jgi:NADP-dependent aldehyde dehydrogenase
MARIMISALTTTGAVTGDSIIAGIPVHGTEGQHRPVDPATGRPLDPAFGLVGAADVDSAASAALECFDEYRGLSGERRAEFLDAIADELERLRGPIIERAMSETGLAEGRLTGELARTTGQLRLFAEEVCLGAFLEVRHDTAMPHRTPTARPDLRLRNIPLGPVAVFGASNFPLAFSTAGGDTASALAAGCPVIVKGHSAHAGTAELAGQAIAVAAARTGMPAGVFSLLFGSGSVVGQQLAAHPAIAAVAFTGSQNAGVALMRTASERPVPIPVYAEMSSINPVFVTPDAIASDDDLVAGLVGSITLGSGQFCTNPGLVFVSEGAAADTLLGGIERVLSDAAGQTMLTAGIHDAYQQGLERLRRAGARIVTVGRPGKSENAPAPVVLCTDAETFARSPQMHEEVFGAAALIVTYRDREQLADALSQLGGQLTATLRISDSDADVRFAQWLLPRLERLVGRIIVNGWPTGVEVSHAMVHGGPFPATSSSRATSVGTLAIARFLRPVSYQNLPETLLPETFSDCSVPRRQDGRLTVPTS